MKPLTPLMTSLGIVIFIIGIAVGYAYSPTYQSTMYDKNTMGLGAPDRWIDLRYVNAMAQHHRAAILLANQAKAQSKRPEIQMLASEIQTNEPKLINELYAWKRKWYNDTRAVSDPSVARLATSDDTFDLRFLNALIAHHEAGILMTSEVRLKSSNADVLNNADAVEAFLKSTLITLKDWRKQWYSVQ